MPFDISPVPPAKITDLSKELFELKYLPAAFAQEVLEANNRTYEERLASCKMIVSPEDTTPTFLGLLTTGKNPQFYLYGAYIQFLRIDGTRLGDPVIDELAVKGDLASMVTKIENKLVAHNRRAVDIGKGRHIISEDYPLSAIQQIFYNAILHRSYENTNAPVHLYWYNDRIEITNPGGPYGKVTIENFGVPGFVDYRNPNLAEVMKNLDMIQRFGQGIMTARNAMERNGNPPLEFDTRFGGILCILRAKT